MNMYLNKDVIKDKILACWIGKNIGGTMGGPFECMTEMNDIKGFTTPKGEPLPNDDLDLQLVWLTAMEQHGPIAMSAAVLSDYWPSYITPHWNEYGTAKANLRRGIMPPMCGELNNEAWKNSNGAWIRSEIWACMCPGVPGAAVKYAVMDACIDHGISEGTYAEMFTAALESMAFFENDIRKLIENALNFIPAECRVAKSIKLVLEEYDKGTPWKTVREMVVDDNKDLGWFQAPGNLAFAVIGLMYGEGDFKKTMIYAINCGDDTDCTAATCGALLGIMGGTQAIPEDWHEHIGNRIITCSVDGAYNIIPKTCDELTDRVMELIPAVMKANGVYTEYTNNETVYDKDAAAKILNDEVKQMISVRPYSFEIRGIDTDAIVEFEKAPYISADENNRFSVTLLNKTPDPKYYNVSLILPDGWYSDVTQNVYLPHNSAKTDGKCTFSIGIIADGNIKAANEVVVKLLCSTHPVPIFIPVTLLG